MSTPAVFDISEMALAMQGDGVDVRHAPAGDSMTLVWISCPKGFDFGPALKGLPHDMCCCEHCGDDHERAYEHRHPRRNVTRSFYWSGLSPSARAHAIIS